MLRIATLAGSLAACALIVVPGTAAASTCSYTGSSGGSWHVAGNWSCNEIPDGGDDVTVSGTTVTVSAAAGAASLALSSSGKITFTNQAVLAVAGAMTVTGVGTLSGAGSTTVAGTFLKTGAGQLAVTNEGAGESADLVLNGAGTIDGGNICIADSGDAHPDLPNLQIHDDFTIATGADAVFVACSSGPTIHINSPDGHLIKTSSGTTQSAGAIENDGTITVQAGELRLGSGTGAATNSGAYLAEPAASLQFADSHVIGTTGRVGGAGTIIMNAVSVTLTTGATFDPAVLNLPFGVLTLDGTSPVSIPVLNISGSASLDTDRPVTATTLTVTAATIRGNGSVTVPAGGTFTKTTSGLLSVSNTGGEGAADLILDVDATLDAGSICVARTGDQDPDQPGLHINRNFAIGAGAEAVAFPCSAGPFVHVNGPDGHLFKTSSGTTTINQAIEVAGGTMTVGAGQVFAVANGVSVTSGVLRGTGQITANVTNTGGEVRPGVSPGTLTISGNYTQGTSGILETEIQGTAPGSGFDHLIVTGTATLAGTLAIVNGPSFDPGPTDTFEIVSAGTVSGTFATLTGASLGSESYTAQYSADDVTLTVVPGPVNTAPPSIAGTATQGQTLTCDPGTWTGSPTFSFEWLRNGTPIAGATGSTYTLTADDVGAQITCRVTATNPAGANQATTTAVTPSAVPVTPTPTPTATPVVTPTPTPTPTPAPVVLPTKASEVAQVFGLPGTRKCLSRRRFPIRLREPRGLRLRSATVRVPGRKAVKARRRNGRMTATVDLRGLPKGRFTITIRVVLTDGRKATGRRRYRTCAPKRG